MAKTIFRTVERFRNISDEEEKWRVALGIGGNHYCSSFNKIELEEDFALSHICAKYTLKSLNEEMLKQAIERTEERVEFVLLDWKGLGEQKERVLKLLDELNIVYEKV